MLKHSVGFGCLYLQINTNDVMIITPFTDNDLYKYSVMLTIQKLYPWVYVKCEFINGGNTCTRICFSIK